VYEYIFIGIVPINKTVAISYVEPFNFAADARFYDIFRFFSSGGITFSLGIVRVDFSIWFILYFSHFCWLYGGDC